MEERREKAYRKTGRVEIIFGCMFSGKSKELIRRLHALEISIKARQDSGLMDPNLTCEDLISVFKPAVDNRRGEGTINSKDGDERFAISIGEPSEIVDIISSKPFTTTVAIDEAQFFDSKSLVDVVDLLANRGIRVIVAGLAANFAAEKWGGIGDLIGTADEVTQLKAVCAVCGEENATFTQRLVKEGGKWMPARKTDQVVLVGEEQYQARCRQHFLLRE